MSTTTGNGGNRRKICLILLALVSLLFQSRIYSAGSLEKKIKKLELEVIEFERKTAGVRAKQKKPAKESVADKKTKAPKEMHMAIPEYDPATRNIAVKNKEEAEKDTAGAVAAEKASEAETPAKILLSDAAGKVEEAEQVQLDRDGKLVAYGSGEIPADIGEHQSIKNIDEKETTARTENLTQQAVAKEKEIRVKVEILDFVNKVEQSI